VARPLDRHRQLTLVLGASAGAAAGLDLAAVGQVAAKRIRLLVVD